jgi:hypothetical protein
LLTEKQLQRGIHRSTRELEMAIDRDLTVYNDAPTPFMWTKTADERRPFLSSDLGLRTLVGVRVEASEEVDASRAHCDDAFAVGEPTAIEQESVDLQRAQTLAALEVPQRQRNHRSGPMRGNGRLT